VSEHPRFKWSSEVDEATWIREATKDREFGTVGSFIPAGFEGYGRLLRPAYADSDETTRVRWRQISEWSGRELKEDSEFHSVAFPMRPPTGQRPWVTRGPRQGSMDGDDLSALVSVLGSATTTPEECWFALWAGYALGGDVPASVIEGPQFELPNRSYLLMTGDLQAAGDIYRAFGAGPNLMWPQDRSWCLASEIDMDSSLIGASCAVIDRLRRSDEFECIGTDRSHLVNRIDDWALDLAEHATDEVIEQGRTELDTYFGTVTAAVRHLRRIGRSLVLETTFTPNGDDEGVSGRVLPLGRGRADAFRDDIQFAVAMELVEHVD
jgi:hypothetical protein